MPPSSDKTTFIIEAVVAFFHWKNQLKNDRGTLFNFNFVSTIHIS
jgi:hypothetical protein